MTPHDDKKRIEALEQKVKDLLRRIAILEQQAIMNQVISL